MRFLTKKHLSVHDGRARFAQVTVALLTDDRERLPEPALYLNDRHVDNPSPDDLVLVASAVVAVREEESRLGVSMGVVKVESARVDAHPEAARLAALSAVKELTAK